MKSNKKTKHAIECRSKAGAVIIEEQKADCDL